MNVTNLINHALSEIGVLAAGETASTEDQSFCLSRLNILLGTLSAKKIFLFFTTKESFTLTVGKAGHTFGSAGDFNSARPVSIEQAFIRDSAGVDHEVRIRPLDEYDLISNKSQSGRPSKLYYNPTHSLGTVYFDVLPDSAYTIYISSKKPLTAYSTITDDLGVPGEVEVALLYLLAQNIAPSFGKSLSPESAVNARAAISAVIGLNLANSMVEAKFTDMPGRTSSYDIDAG